MKSVHIAPVGLALLLLPSVGRGATLEIFPGDSFETAVESLAPGDRLIVHQGTYSDSGRISVSVQGTELQPVVVQGAEGEPRPFITRPEGSSAQNTINIEGASYLTIRGLEISGNGDGINMNSNPHHINLEDNVIHDIDVGVNFRSSMDFIVVRRNHIYNTAGTGEGMYVGCNNAACAVSDSLIENNWIHNTGGSQGDGIEIKYGSWGNIVRDNVIHDANFPCILAYGVTDANVARPNIIEGNVVWNCGQSIDVIADAMVRNNIVIGTLETQSHNQVPVMRNVSIINNTVIGDMPLRGWGSGSVPESLIVANNVTYDGAITNRPAGAVLSANQEYAAGTPGIFADPTNQDYWPALGSPLIEAGDGTHASAVDFNGTVRQIPFDVGAYESNGRATNPGWPIQDNFKVEYNLDTDACQPGPLTLGPVTFYGTQTHRSETILSTFGAVAVNSSADITFEAAAGIALRPGFSVAAGGHFAARIAAVDCQVSQPTVSIDQLGGRQQAAEDATTTKHSQSVVPTPRPLRYDDLPRALQHRLEALGVDPGDLTDIQASADGEEIVFASPFALVQDDDNAQSDVYRYRTSDDLLQLLSRSWGGSVGNGASDQPRIDGWGEYVVYRSSADNLSETSDTNAVTDIFLTSLIDDMTYRVSWTETGDETTTPAAHPDLGGEQLIIVYDLEAKLGQRGIYGFEAETGQLSERQDQGLCDAHHPALSADARHLAYLCGEPFEPGQCRLHFIDRRTAEHRETDCPLGLEPGYRLHFTEDPYEIVFRQSSEPEKHKYR